MFGGGNVRSPGAKLCGRDGTPTAGVSCVGSMNEAAEAAAPLVRGEKSIRG